MIYTPMTKKALCLAFEAHKNQRDKSGLPYVFHPFHLAEQMTDELTTVTALLHDVVEDSSFTFDDLDQMGFPSDVLTALHLLTHDKSVPYLDYVARIRPNPIARQVKLADLLQRPVPAGQGHGAGFAAAGEISIRHCAAGAGRIKPDTRNRQPAVPFKDSGLPVCLW